MKIKTISILLSLFHLGSASALGLGDLTVRSTLGQPLHATVSLLGATSNTTADCFSLGASTSGLTPLVRAQLNIERAGSKTLLHIRTPQTLNDPIAQFVLISDCETRLTRDYVVLLDPPSRVESAATTSSLTPVAQLATTPIVAENALTARPVKSRKPRPKPRTVRTARSTSQTDTPRSPSAANTSAPRLVISGRYGHAASGTLALRFDTNLPDLTRAPAAPMTATEVSDENTALTRKLAYLETQLASLQQRNADLEARATTGTTPKPAPSTKLEQSTPWFWYVVFVVVLAGIGFLAAWILRRSRPRRIPLSDEPGWAPDDDDAMPALPVPMNVTPVAKKQVAAAPQKVATVVSLDLGQSDMSPLEPASTEVNDDILDQAEVYMAHGHGELAVHLLQEHLREFPTESPVPWLLLLDLLQRDGEMDAYATASAECRRYFNINLTGQPASQEGDAAQGLEAYPLILNELVRVWKLPEAKAFFDELIHDNRGGTRVGFEPSVYRDILMLRDIAEQDQATKAA
ncbi:MAG: hypothetical protein ABIQ90_14915 [Polaromonas sp.]